MTTFRVHVLLFAGLREAVGEGSVELELPAGADVEVMLDRLCSAHPAAAPHRASLRVALNEEYVTGDAAIHVGDEVALIPPVAGG